MRPSSSSRTWAGSTSRAKLNPSRPIASWNGRLSLGRLRGIEGLNAPLIGRDQEQELLRTAVAEVAQGSGQLFSVMGEAGPGKSRLIAELRNGLTADGMLNGAHPSAVNWIEGQSLSYETATPYAPFISLFTDYFGLQSDYSPDDQYRKVHETVSSTAAEAVDGIAPFIAALLGSSSQVRRRSGYGTWSQPTCGRKFSALLSR